MPKRRLNISLIAIVGEGLLSRLSFGLISFTLPLYARHLGLSLTEVGILAALNSAVAVALKRSEEHTSELQSRLHLVCRLLLEKKKTYILLNLILHKQNIIA